MKLNIATLVTFGVGAVLVYSAIKNVDPREVVKQALGGKAPTPRGTAGDQGKSGLGGQGSSGGGTGGGGGGSWSSYLSPGVDVPPTYPSV